MSNVALLRRLDRMEIRTGADNPLRNLTDDELNVALLDAGHAVLANPELASMHEQTGAAVREIEDAIRAHARRVRSPDYARHLEWVSIGYADYVPSLCGDEYDGLRHPKIMKRRAALRARADVRALIAEGESYHG